MSLGYNIKGVIFSDEIRESVSSDCLMTSTSLILQHCLAFMACNFALFRLWFLSLSFNVFTLSAPQITTFKTCPFLSVLQIRKNMLTYTLGLATALLPSLQYPGFLPDFPLQAMYFRSINFFYFPVIALEGKVQK